MTSTKAVSLTTQIPRTPPDGPQVFPSADVFPFIERFTSRQGWLERVRRTISFVFDKVHLIPPAFKIAWVCFNIGWNLFDLIAHKKAMESLEQAVVPAASVGLLATNNMRKRRFKMRHAVGQVEERDKLPHSPGDRVDTCSESSLAPESRATSPSNPHLSSSFHPSPLAPPTLRQGDSSGESPSLSAPSPPSKIISVLNPTKGESTAADAELTSLRQSVLTKTRSTSHIPQEPDVNRTSLGRDPNATHDPSPQSSPNQPSPPSPLAEWTPFIATNPLQAGYVKKQSRKSDFWGGFSEVFRAEIRSPAPEPEPEFKRDVALKILKPFGLKGKGEDQVSTRLTERLNQETFTWVRLVHPNVVPLLGFTFAPLPSLISPWYERGNLRSYLEHCPSANRMKLISDVAKGLEYLHSRTPRIAHGDIKPENVLINEQGDALLSDFGLTTVLGDEHFYTTSHQWGGSFGYMAPELFRGEQRTCSADVYSFANLAFEILTNHLPPSGLEANMSDYKDSEDLIDNWSQYPELEPIADILRRCRSRSPEKRPSMTEIVRELSALVR